MDEFTKDDLKAAKERCEKMGSPLESVATYLNDGDWACEILPRALAALEEARRENEDWREIARIIENLCYDSRDYAVQTYGRPPEDQCD